MLLQTPIWRQTPPAIFPTAFGFMALALGWRNAADVWTWLPQDIGNLLLALSTAYFLWFLMFYFLKVAARPSVIMDDMRTPPARAGMAAAAMSMMLLAAALLPLGFHVPLVWWVGVAMSVFATVVVLRAIWTDPPERRHFSTFQYLTFVGPVVGPIAGVPLGHAAESVLLINAALVAWLIVTAGILLTWRRDPPPPALRPSVALFLAPTCLFALGYDSLGWGGGFAVFYWLGNLVALALLALLPWMIRGGYGPVWAAFAVAAALFLEMQAAALARGYGLAAEIGTWAGLVIATPVVLWIAWRMMMQWVTGELTRRSHGAIA